MKTILVVILAASAAWGQSVYTGTWTGSGSATWSASSGNADTTIYVAPGALGSWTDLGLNFNSCGASCRGWKISLDADTTHANYWVNTEGLFYNAERRYRPRANAGNYLNIADACFTSSQGGVANQDYIQL